MVRIFLNLVYNNTFKYATHSSSTNQTYLTPPSPSDNKHTHNQRNTSRIEINCNCLHQSTNTIVHPFPEMLQNINLTRCQ